MRNDLETPARLLRTSDHRGFGCAVERRERFSFGCPARALPASGCLRPLPKETSLPAFFQRQKPNWYVLACTSVSGAGTTFMTGIDEVAALRSGRHRRADGLRHPHAGRRQVRRYARRPHHRGRPQARGPRHRPRRQRADPRPGARHGSLDDAIDVVITTGGTGFTGRDVTPEALEPLFEKRMDGFSEVFHRISYDKIGTSTIQSPRHRRRRQCHLHLRACRDRPAPASDAWDGILEAAARLPAHAVQFRRDHAAARRAPEARLTTRAPFGTDPLPRIPLVAFVGTCARTRARQAPFNCSERNARPLSGAILAESREALRRAARSETMGMHGKTFSQTDIFHKQGHLRATLGVPQGTPHSCFGAAAELAAGPVTASHRRRRPTRICRLGKPLFSHSFSLRRGQRRSTRARSCSPFPGSEEAMGIGRARLLENGSARYRPLGLQAFDERAA